MVGAISKSLFFPSKDQQDTSLPHNCVFPFNKFDPFTADGDQNRFTIPGKMIRDLTAGNDQAKHPAEVFEPLLCQLESIHKLKTCTSDSHAMNDNSNQNQSITRIDAEIAEKGHFWMETSLISGR